MEKTLDRCSCHWTGESFAQHYKDTYFDDQPHIEQKPVKDLNESRAA